MFCIEESKRKLGRFQNTEKRARTSGSQRRHSKDENMLETPSLTCTTGLLQRKGSGESLTVLSYGSMNPAQPGASHPAQSSNASQSNDAASRRNSKAVGESRNSNSYDEAGGDSVNGNLKSLRKPQRERWWTMSHTLENKGSVARDHLANERTYLAWLRTSLALASIGIAITQLFRLQNPTQSTPSSVSMAQLGYQDDASLAMQQLFAEYSGRLNALEQASISNTSKYRRLGKPLGGTFIILALVFLVLGSRRYFAVQSALIQTPSAFAPTRKGVIFSSFCVAGIIVASFASILSTK